jgi:carotenoid cleavage dioxygenase-like enzyme
MPEEDVFMSVEATRAATVLSRGAVAAEEAWPDLATRAPFRAREADERVHEATVRGALPEWLRGDLVRCAPAGFARGEWRAHHWFDALGLLYSFRVSGAGVSYRQRMMASDTAREIEQGRKSPRGSFGTPRRQGFLQRLFTPIPEVTDNPNVNVLQLGDDRVALTESPHQWAFDPETLSLTRKLEYTDREGKLIMLAHAHMDFARGKVVNLATRVGLGGAELVLYEHAPTSRERSVVARIPVGRMPYVHSFGLTERHAVVVGHPFDVNPLRLLWMKEGLIDHFDFRPEAGTTLWLVDRSTGKVRAHTAPPGFVFHVINAFEDGASTSIDLALYPDAGIVGALRVDSIAKSGLPRLAPPIVRWTVTEGARAARSETLLADGFEFPSVSYRKKNGRRHDVAWGARVDGNGTRSELVRIGPEGLRTFEEGGFVFGEPVFVARPGGEREDDGVLVAVGSASSGATCSAMAVLDAATLEVRAWAEVPLPVPLGFHGSFFRA